MYRLSKDDVKLLNNLLLMKDLNPEDGYSKEKVIEYVKADRELNEANSIRFAIMCWIRILNMGLRKMMNRMN